jgi:cytoskeletal protein RodZ
MNTLSEILKNRRIERKLTLEEIHTRTRIPIKFIEALESGEPAKFPAEVYLLGTLRRYSEFLGLDPAELIKIYKDNKKSKESAQEITFEPEMTSVHKSFWPSEKPSSQKPSAGEPPARKGVQPSDAEKPWAWAKYIYAAAIIVFFFVAIISLSPRKIHKENPKPVPAPAVVAEKVQPAVSTPVKQVAPAATVVKEPLKGNLQLDVAASTPSWVRVYADDETVFEGTFQRGEHKKFEAEESFRLIIGYAPGIKVRLNNRLIDVTAAAKQDVTDIRLTEENLK